MTYEAIETKEIKIKNQRKITKRLKENEREFQKNLINF